MVATCTDLPRLMSPFAALCGRRYIQARRSVKQAAATDVLLLSVTPGRYRPKLPVVKQCARAHRMAVRQNQLTARRTQERSGNPGNGLVLDPAQNADVLVTTRSIRTPKNAPESSLCFTAPKTGRGWRFAF